MDEIIANYSLDEASLQFTNPEGQPVQRIA